MSNAPHTPLLRHHGVLPLISGRALSTLAAQMQAVILGWQIYALTGSTFALGLVGLAQFFPVLTLSFVAGHVIDRGDRRQIARLCQGVQASVALALACVALMPAPPLAAIYALLTIGSAARAFEGPSTQALLPALVPEALFPRAAALSSSLFQTACILGPSLGGLLYGLGPVAAYGAAALFFASAALSLALVPARPPAPGREKPTLAAVFGGVTYIAQRPDILGAISLDLFAVLLGGATALMPAYARDILHAGPLGLGLLRAAPAMGAVCVAIYLARWPMKHHLGLKMFAAVAVFGAFTLVFAVSRSIPLSVLALAILGASDVVSVVVRSSLVQMRTPDHMRGRVAAVNMLFIGSSNQLGEFESGMMATALGTVPSVVVGGLGTLAVVALWMVLFPSLRRLDQI